MTGGLGVLLLVPSLVGSRPGVKFCWTGEPRLLGGLPTCDLLMNLLYIGVSMPYRLLVLMWLLGWPVSGLLVGVRRVVFPPRLTGGFGMVAGLTGLSALIWSLELGLIRDCAPLPLRCSLVTFKRALSNRFRPSIQACRLSLRSIVANSLRSSHLLPSLFCPDRLASKIVMVLPRLSQFAGPSSSTALIRSLLGSLPPCSRRHVGCCFCRQLCTRPVSVIAFLPLFHVLSRLLFWICLAR